VRRANFSNVIVLGDVKGTLAVLGGFAALDAACARWTWALVVGWQPVVKR
jgi:hypothetical protein